MIAHVGLVESGQGVLGESEDLVLELRDVERRHLRLGRGHVELARADLLRGHLWPKNCLHQWAFGYDTSRRAAKIWSVSQTCVHDNS